VLEAIGARQDLDAPFGDWQTGPDGEQHWIEREPTLLQSRHGAIDVVPTVSGSYDELIPQAAVTEVDGQQVWIESIADLLTTLTVPRRQKDRGRVEELRAIQRAVIIGRAR
jgi:hypothetical protein